MSNTVSKHYKLADHVSLTKLDDEAVLLDLDTGAYYGLNHVGLALIEALNNGLSLETAVDKIKDRYSAQRETVQQDANALIEDMLNQRIISMA